MLPKCGEAALPTPKLALQAGPAFSGESLLERAMAALGAPDSPKVYRLTESKRLGAPLAAYLARAHPDLCAALAASPSLGKTTPVVHVWRTAPCHSWCNLGYFLGSTRRATSEAQPRGNYQRPPGTMVSSRGWPRVP